MYILDLRLGCEYIATLRFVAHRLQIVRSRRVCWICFSQMSVWEVDDLFFIRKPWRDDFLALLQYSLIGKKSPVK